MKGNMKWVELVATLLVIVGAINWGVIGFTNLFMGSEVNLVHMVLSFSTQVEWLVYVLVGLSGVWLFYDWWMRMSKGKK